jgi:phenylpyruvate tautomerase PptA (4-oxalocrotonate tautomerase family)
MPYARISMLKGKPAEYRRALSDSVYRAMVESFNVPENDLFQIFHQLDRDELVFDRHYMGGPRSDDFVHIAITTGKPRTREMKLAFYRRTVELLAESPGIQPRDVMIVLSTSLSEDWSFADGVAGMLEAKP